MPRCYMLKKYNHRNESPSLELCSPTDASVAPPCYTPTEDPESPEESTTEYAEIGGIPLSERSAEEKEAAHDLLSLANSVPPLPPTAVVTVLAAPPDPATPIVPVYAYTLQPTNIYIIAEDAPDTLYRSIPAVQPVEYTVEQPIDYVTYQPQPQPPVEVLQNCTAPPPREEERSPPPTRHIATNIKDKSNKYDCRECGKRYATSSNLSRHKQTHRSLDSGAAKRCNECGKVYVSMPALAMHVLTHRMGHVCSVCGKQFSRPWLLRGHLRSHTGEKPYSCTECGKSFADRSNLRAHLQTHSLDKKYECSRCHKPFALKSYLNKHQESACINIEDP